MGARVFVVRIVGMSSIGVLAKIIAACLREAEQPNKSTQRRSWMLAQRVNTGGCEQCRPP